MKIFLRIALRIVLFATLAVVVWVVVVGFRMRNGILATRDWFEGNPDAKLTGLALESNGKRVFVTDQGLLSQLDLAMKTNSPLRGKDGSWACAAFIQINGKWANPVQFACYAGQIDICVGAPKGFFRSDYEYVQVTVGSNYSQALYEIISDGYREP